MGDAFLVAKIQSVNYMRKLAQMYEAMASEIDKSTSIDEIESISDKYNDIIERIDI